MPDTHAPHNWNPGSGARSTGASWWSRCAPAKSYRPKAWKDGARCAVALSVRLRPRDQRAARRRQVDRPAVAGASTATGSACRASCKLLEKHGVKATFYVPAVAALLHPDEQRARGRRGPRDRHPRLDPRAQLGAAATRPSATCMLRSADTLEKITGVRAGRHAHAVVGFQPQHARHRRRRWGCSTTPR